MVWYPHASKAHAFQRAVGTTPVNVPVAVPVDSRNYYELTTELL